MGLSGETSGFVSVLEWNEQRYFAIAEPKKGDLNLDGTLTVADIGSLEVALRDQNAFETKNGLMPSDLVALGDVDVDNIVTNADLQAILVKLANAGGAGSTTAVPEPSTSALLLFGGLILSINWPRREKSTAATLKR